MHTYKRLEITHSIFNLDVDTEKDCVTTPVPYGGFVLFNNVTPHRRYIPSLRKFTLSQFGQTRPVVLNMRIQISLLTIILNSLNNVSNDIRWSIDLRWFEAGKSVGLWQMKDGVLLRSKDPNFKVDWTAFDSVDRQQAAYEYLGQVSLQYDSDVRV